MRALEKIIIGSKKGTIYLVVEVPAGESEHVIAFTGIEQSPTVDMIHHRQLLCGDFTI